MRLAFYISVAAIAAGLLFGSAGSAAAQSDRTLGINCKVAGHQHCDTGYRSYRWHRAYR